jgi:hypothetical protein
LFTARGEPLTAFFDSTSDQDCSGSFEGLKRFEETTKQKGAVSGWAWLRNESRGPETIVLADDGNVIVGLARGLQPRPDIAAYFRNPKMFATGWSGYYDAGRSSRILTGYAILPGGKTLCPVGHVNLEH